MNTVAKAKLVKLAKPGGSAQKTPASGGADTDVLEVDFNPQSLKLTYQNKSEGGKQAKPGESQYLGMLDASLNLELLFDSTQSAAGKPTGEDVRKKTQKIFELLMPDKAKRKDPKATPPIVRFEWGSFLFEGLIKSMNETLDFFSSEGIPLRSTVSLTMTTTTDLILFNDAVKRGKTADFNRSPPGTEPKQAIAPGDSLQKAAGKNGDSSNWRAIAAANNIDNPLRPPTGVPLSLSGNLSVGGSVSGGASAGASFGGSASAGLGGGAQAGIGGSLGGGASGGVNAQAGFSAGIGGGVGFGAGASGGISAGASGGISGGVSGGADFGGGASFGASLGGSVGGSAGGSFSASVGFGGSVGGSASGSLGASASASGSFGVKKRI